MLPTTSDHKILLMYWFLGVFYLTLVHPPTHCVECCCLPRILLTHANAIKFGDEHSTLSWLFVSFQVALICQAFSLFFQLLKDSGLVLLQPLDLYEPTSIIILTLVEDIQATSKILSIIKILQPLWRYRSRLVSQ